MNFMKVLVLLFSIQGFKRWKCLQFLKKDSSMRVIIV